MPGYTMKGLLEGSREDLKLLLTRLGFAVSLPLAGYLAVNSSLRSSSSSESPDSGAVGKSATLKSFRDSKSLKDEIHILESKTDGQSAIHASTSCGKNLKDEIHIQESEEALTKIIHGTSVLATITKAIDEHSPCMQLSLPETGRSLMRLTHVGPEAKQVEMGQEIGRSHLLEYCGSNNQRAVVREIEDHFEINMMMASSWALKIQSLDEQNRTLTIQDSEYSGMISELESVRVIIHNLMKVLKSDWLHSTHKMTALEQQTTMCDSKNDDEQNNNNEAESNSKKLMELKDKCINLRENILSSAFGTNAKMMVELKDECINLCEDIKVKTNSMTLIQVKDVSSNLSEMTVSSDKKNSELVGMWEFEENPVSSPSTPKDQEAEVEETEKERQIKQPPDEHHNTKFVEILYGGQINNWIEYEQNTYDSSTDKATESCHTQSLAAKMQKEAEEVVVKKNEYSKDPNKGNFPSPQISSESLSCSSDISLMTSNSSIDRSKHHRAHRTKIFSKLKKIFLGKKGKTLTSKTPIDSSSHRKESVSTSYSDDSSKNSRLNDLSCSSLGNTTIEHFSKKSSDRWQSNTAWCQSFYRTPFDVSRAKVFALQEGDMRAFYEGKKEKPIISSKMVNCDNHRSTFSEFTETT